LLPSLAANMLGEDKPPSEDQQHDALCEVANVVCGNVLPRIGGSQEIFNLNPPEIVASDAPVGNGPVPLMAKVRFDFEEGRAELFLFAQQAEQASVEEL
ncbi:MAG: chemotaxis protein CheX, partial [bacterium]|nr:chemotaxis protein CheX [bacterium]